MAEIVEAVRSPIDSERRPITTPFQHAAHELSSLGVSGRDLSYSASLYAQYLSPRERVLRIGSEFTPVAFLSPEQRQNLGIVDYARDILSKDRYREAAKQTTLVAHPLDAGTALPIKRLAFLETHWAELGRTGEPRIGAKGTDLAFTVKTDSGDILVPIMEIKLLRLLNSANKYNEVFWQEVLNEDSFPSFESFLESTTLMGRLRRGVAQTYRQLFLPKESQVKIAEPIIQAFLPTIEAQTLQLTCEHLAPGGHGQIGTYLLKEFAEQAYEGEVPRVHALYNGDGTNNTISPEMVGFSVSEKAGVVMVTTTRLDGDSKGGILGVTQANGREFIDILEMVQAEKAGQSELFQRIGLGSKNEAQDLGVTSLGIDQLFNTNTIIFNETLLGTFLSKLKTHFGDEGFAQIIAPDLIGNVRIANGKYYKQLEGAVGSVVLRLNAFVQADPYAQSLWKDISGGTQFLRIINIDSQQRDNFFTPIKSTWDFWLQAYSDHFMLDTSSWTLVNEKPGHMVNVNATVLKDPFYADIQNLIAAFGNASVRDLDELIIDGHVLLANSTLKGVVQIKSEFNGIFNLNDLSICSNLPQTPEGNILLENVRVTVDEKGEVSVDAI